MTKRDRNKISKIQNKQVKEVLRTIQKHDTQLIPSSLDTIVDYIVSLEERHEKQ
jgi:hypothetical protein